MPLVSFYTPWKHQKTRGFLMLSGGVERDHWYEMGYTVILRIKFLIELRQILVLVAWIRNDTYNWNML